MAPFSTLDYSRQYMKRMVFCALSVAMLLLNACSVPGSRNARNGLLDLRGESDAKAMVGAWLVEENGKSHTAFAPLRSPLLRPRDSRPSSWLLNVLTPGAGEYALLIPFPEEVRSVFVGDVPLWITDGNGPSPARPKIVSFHADSSALIRVEVPAGGRSPGNATLFASPYIVGSVKAVESFRITTSVSAGVRLGVFAGAALLTFLFAVFCHGGKGFLSLAGFLFCSLVFLTIRDSYALGMFALPSNTLDRLYVCALCLQQAILGIVAITIFPKMLRKAARAVAVAPSLLLALAAVAPDRFLEIGYILASGWAIALQLALMAYAGFQTAVGNRRSLFFLFAVLTLTVSHGLRWIAGDSLFLAQIVEPAGTIVFSLLSTVMLIRKIGDSFDEAENLTSYVDSVSATVRRFIPAEFMEYLQKTDITDLKLGDHVEKEMTIFFSDIRSFTQLSEGLTPEENFAFINSYLARMVPLIKERGGFVDKYVGDAIMALFPDSGGADQALRTALDMQNRMVEYNRHRASVGYKPIEMGIGIHTGTLMLGVVGVQDRMENTVISDAVNLSSRLQAIAKAFNIGVVISEQSFKSLDDAGLFKYRFVGKVRVKGKAAPVSCFEIFDDTKDAAFELKMKANTFFEQGMLSYYQKTFVDAIYYFKRALEILPEDGAARFYLETCLRKTR